MIQCHCQHSLSCFWLPCSITSAHHLRFVPRSAWLGKRTGACKTFKSPWHTKKHVKKDKSTTGKCKVVVRKPSDTVGSQRDTELTLKHSEDFLTGMIHHIKTPHRWITPPWDLISPDILHSITWAPSDDSTGLWAKQDHDVPQNKISIPSSTSLLHPSNMPPLYLSIGHISQKDFWKGKDNLPVQNSQVPWLLYTKLTS